MAEEYDILAEKQKALKKRVGNVYEIANPKQKAGEFTLVRELEFQPFDGHSLEVKRGQSFRFELDQGNQVLDIMFLNKDNPDKEFFAQFPSCAMGGLVPREGFTFMSSTPYFRPMATMIRDTVSYERLEEKMGTGGQHMFIFPTGRCSEWINEFHTGIVNPVSCNSNFQNELNRLGGEALMRVHLEQQCFCCFQPTKWEIVDGVPFMSYYTSENIFRSGDYIEMIAHQDLIIVVSMCPYGDHTNLEDITQNRSWPIKVKIFDTGIDLPEPEPQKSLSAIDLVKQNRKGMTEFLWGEPGGENSFEWEAKQRGE